MKTPLLLSVMVAALAVIGYMLFWDFDVVWPFFLLPYLVFSILFLIRYFRAKEKMSFLARSRAFFRSFKSFDPCPDYPFRDNINAVIT